MYVDLCPRVVLFRANTKNLAICGAAYPRIILKARIIIISFSPLLLAHSFSTYLHSLFWEARICVDI